MDFRPYFKRFRRLLIEKARDLSRDFEGQFIERLDSIVKHDEVAKMEDLPYDPDEDLEELDISDIENDEEEFANIPDCNVLAIGETVREDGTRASRHDDAETRKKWRANTVRSVIMPDGTIKPWSQYVSRNRQRVQPQPSSSLADTPGPAPGQSKSHPPKLAETESSNGIEGNVSGTSSGSSIGNLKEKLRTIAVPMVETFPDCLPSTVNFSTILEETEPEEDSEIGSK